MTITLSVLDQSPIIKDSNAEHAFYHTTRLAQLTEKLGYQRFWVSEHHSTQSLAGSAPEILIAHLAANTSSIRVGSGGVLLPHYSSYKVAEAFRVLEALYPKRIDLGIGRAPGGMPNINRALHDGAKRSVERYPEQLEELIAYLQGKDPSNINVYATPFGDTMPEIWLLGSSGTSAMLAADIGAAYSFAHFINAVGGDAAMEHYQGRFLPSMLNSTPKANVTVFAICAESEAEADYLASSLDLALLTIEQGMSRNGFPSPEEALSYSYTSFERERIKENRKRMVVGTPTQIKEQLEQLSRKYSVNEIMINTITHSFEKRVKSYELIAEAFELSAQKALIK